MRDANLKKVLCIRKAFQMTAISVILVLVISIIIVVTAGPTGDVSVPICGPVPNMELKETDTQLIITWDTPIGSGCNTNVLFRVYVTRNGDNIQTVPHHESLELEVRKESCSEYVIIVCSMDINGATTENSTIEHFSGIAGTGRVLNPEFTEENRLQWNPPENSEACNLLYRVKIVPQNFQPDEPIETEENFIENVSLIPCSENEIFVTSVVVQTKREGLVADIHAVGPTRRSAPHHVHTEPMYTSASVMWTLKEELNNCEIEEIEFTLTTDAGDVVRIFQPNDEGNYLLEGLSQETRHSYFARWILEGQKEAVASDSILFKTVPLTNPTSIYSVRWEDGVVRITWEQEYEMDFITQYEVEIENMGPQHFMPEKCPTGEGDVYREELENGQNTMIFPQARSNFKYRVRVITHFGGLGLHTSDVAETVVPMEAPDALEEVTSHHDFERGVPYEVTSYVDWKIPCNINGPISHFQLTISGKLTVPGVTESCTVSFLMDTVAGAEKETFSFETKSLIPFFEYTITIRTVLETSPLLHRETPTIMSSLPVPYTPQN